MRTRDLHGRKALVTGAGSGIGRATALALGARGADLVLCDVDEAGLADTAAALRASGRSVLSRRVDVADEAAMRAFAAEVEREAGALDVLVNNAGVGLGAGFLDTSLDDWRWILGVNLWGVVHGCHFFVPPMLARGGPAHVVNVASMAAYVPSEQLAAYTTTKYAVLGLSESLRIELGRRGIGVSAICPGIINTNITKTAQLRGAAAQAPGAREQMVAAYQRRNYGPERVASAILRAIQRNRAVAPVSPEAWVLYYAKRLAPGLVHWVGQRLAERSFPGAPAR
jgi:NAD(P)-dependent dehydrogenase (short-subunit alcohol dehydrogenase family)